jgi:hypothetical protein
MHRAWAESKWISEADRHRLIGLNDRICLAPGNPISPGEEDFMNALLRRSEKMEPVQ